jgi:hypothetical protein
VEAFKAPNKKDVAYSAVQQVRSALRGMLARLQNPDPEAIAVMYYFPLIVTTSPLYLAALAPDSERVVTRRLPWGSVMVDESERRSFEVVVADETALPSIIDLVAGVPEVAQEFLDSFDRSLLSRQLSHADHAARYPQ